MVKQSLRRSVFIHPHAGTSGGGGHLGEYKTLYKMRLQLFWPKLREDVKQWVKGCAHCVSYNVFRNRKQDLNFSWSVTISFYITNLDIWSPVTALHKNQEGCHILDAMCDLTQLTISSITEYTKSE